MVDESTRIWDNIDNFHKSIGDHCIRLTKLEQTHLYNSNLKDKVLIYLITAVAIAEGIYLFLK
jgi:hypothetical protein